MTFSERADRWISPFGRFLYDGFMENLGIATSRRISKAYTRLRYRKAYQEHWDAARFHLSELLQENREKTRELPREGTIKIEDGWAIDRTKSLPFLEDLLQETDPIIDRPGGRIHSDIQTPYFRNLLFPEDTAKYPSFVNFPTSSAILETVIDYMKIVPVLSRTRPPGLRMMESNQALDDRIDAPYEESQLYHLDLHDSPLVYVVVLLRDVTEDCGPWTFLPASVSSDAQRQLLYQQRGRPYRITDEQMYECIDPEDRISFTGEKGDVLFIDSSRCFHYGSRNAIEPRLLMMYGYTTPARTDLTMAYLPHYPYPQIEDPSKLREMITAPL